MLDTTALTLTSIWCVSQNFSRRRNGGTLFLGVRTYLCVLSQVIAVGSGKEDEDGKIVKPNLNKGDTVLYSRYSGTEFTGQDDKQYIVIRESDVLAAVS